MKKELGCLVSEGILVHMTPDEPSDWLNSFVSDEKIHLCLDPTQLNKYIITLRHNTRLVDPMLPRLTEVKHFTIMDCMSSFFMQRLTFRHC